MGSGEQHPPLTRGTPSFLSSPRWGEQPPLPCRPRQRGGEGSGGETARYTSFLEEPMGPPLGTMTGGSSRSNPRPPARSLPPATGGSGLTGRHGCTHSWSSGWARRPRPRSGTAEGARRRRRACTGYWSFRQPVVVLAGRKCECLQGANQG
ncbi:hypothetical protein VPH35_009586 [Triticum aestivum]